MQPLMSSPLKVTESPQCLRGEAYSSKFSRRWRRSFVLRCVNCLLTSACSLPTACRQSAHILSFHLLYRRPLLDNACHCCPHQSRPSALCLLCSVKGNTAVDINHPDCIKPREDVVDGYGGDITRWLLLIIARLCQILPIPPLRVRPLSAPVRAHPAVTADPRRLSGKLYAFKLLILFFFYPCKKF